MTTDIPYTKLVAFFNRFAPVAYKKKALVLYAHDKPSSVIYIKRGFVRVFRISEQGEELSLTILKPNDLFPLTYGIHSSPNPYFLEAITSLEVVKVPKEQFQDFITSHQDVYLALTTQVLIKFDSVLARMEHLVFQNASTKVAATLLMLASRFGITTEKKSSRLIPIPLTHKDIATFVGITRETASIEVKKLEKKGFVGRMGKYFLIKRYNSLHRQVFATSKSQATLYYAL